MTDSIGTRMQAIRQRYGLSQKAMSKKLGLSANVWGNSETNATVPSGDTLIRIAELGFNPTWVLTGKGFMLLEEPSEAGEMEAGAELVSDIDTELLGRIVDLIAREAKACGVSIPPIDLGRKAGEKYAELMAASDSPAERLAMLKLMAVQLRNELRAPPVSDGNPLARKGSA